MARFALANGPMGREEQIRAAKKIARASEPGAVVVGTSIRQAIWIAIYLELNARLQMQAMAMGKIKFLTRGEVVRIIGRQKAFSYNRAWENWCVRPAAGCRRWTKNDIEEVEPMRRPVNRIPPKNGFHKCSRPFRKTSSFATRLF